MEIYTLDVGTIDNNYIHYIAICTTKYNSYWFRGSTQFDPWPDPLWPEPRVRQGSGYGSDSLTKLWPVQVRVTKKSLVNRPDLNNGNTSQPGGESDRPPSQPRPQKVNRSKVARWQGWKSRGKLSKKHKGQTNVKRPDAVKGLSWAWAICHKLGRVEPLTLRRTLMYLYAYFLFVCQGVEVTCLHPTNFCELPSLCLLFYFPLSLSDLMPGWIYPKGRIWQVSKHSEFGCTVAVLFWRSLSVPRRSLCAVDNSLGWALL